MGDHSTSQSKLSKDQKTMQGAKESLVIVIYLAANSDAQKEERPIAFAAAATTVGGSNSLPRPERNKPATDGIDGRPSLLRAQQHGVDADPIMKIKVLLLCIK